MVVSLGNWVATGAYTIAAILKRRNDTEGGRDVICDVNGPTGVTLAFEATDNRFFSTKSSVDDFPTTPMIVIRDEWVLVAFDKAAGSDNGRLHYYNYTTGIWIHSAGTAASTDNSPTSLNWSRTGTECFMNLLVGAAWDRQLSDAEYETLTSGLAVWISHSPQELWRFNSMDPIVATVGTSTETSRIGTSLENDVPSGWSDGDQTNYYRPRLGWPGMVRG